MSVESFRQKISPSVFLFFLVFLSPTYVRETVDMGKAPVTPPPPPPPPPPPSVLDGRVSSFPSTRWVGGLCIDVLQSPAACTGVRWTVIPGCVAQRLFSADGLSSSEFTAMSRTYIRKALYSLGEIRWNYYHSGSQLCGIASCWRR